MFGIIRHAWLDEVRAQRRRRQLFVSAAEGEGEQVGDSPMERQQEWIAVQAAMARLPDEQRWPIALVLIEGLSYRDAAAVLEIPIGTVTSRLARGRDALQALLEENREGHRRIHSAGLRRRRVDTRPGRRVEAALAADPQRAADVRQLQQVKARLRNGYARCSRNPSRRTCWMRHDTARGHRRRALSSRPPPRFKRRRQQRGGTQRSVGPCPVRSRPRC
nr:RNA polymerase sigma factor [Xanthomonas vasicola]MDO6947243.1 RNA polymerase sigma factor [Xanthomonas vasicola]